MNFCDKTLVILALSILVPVYNGDAYLVATLEHVLA
jgi:hypothetical protein